MVRKILSHWYRTPTDRLLTDSDHSDSLWPGLCEFQLGHLGGVWLCVCGTFRLMYSWNYYYYLRFKWGFVVRLAIYQLRMSWSCCSNNYMLVIAACMRAWPGELLKIIALSRHDYYDSIFAGLPPARIAKLKLVHRPVALLILRPTSYPSIWVSFYTIRTAYWSCTPSRPCCRGGCTVGHRPSYILSV